MKNSVFKSVLNYYKKYSVTHKSFPFADYNNYKKELTTYDPVKKQEIFEMMLRELEDKLTKAKKKGKTKRLNELEKDVHQLVSGRRQEYGDFDCQGFGKNGVGASSTLSIRYDTNGEANIIVEFKPEHIVMLSTAELIKILGGRSLNKHQEEATTQEERGMEVIVPAKNNSDKTDICGWDGGCSYDCYDCGCDEYYK